MWRYGNGRCGAMVTAVGSLERGGEQPARDAPQPLRRHPLHVLALLIHPLQHQRVEQGADTGQHRVPPRGGQRGEDTDQLTEEPTQRQAESRLVRAETVSGLTLPHTYPHRSHPITYLPSQISPYHTLTLTDLTLPHTYPHRSHPITHLPL